MLAVHKWRTITDAFDRLCRVFHSILEFSCELGLLHSICIVTGDSGSLCKYLAAPNGIHEAVLSISCSETGCYRSFDYCVKA